MSLSKSITSWLGAWQYVLILVVVCLLLAWLNVWQWKRSLRAHDRAEIAALNDAIDKVNGISARKVNDDAKTQERFDAIADQSEQALRRYSKAAGQNPLPIVCAPGQGRVDAINQGLGPQQ